MAPVEAEIHRIKKGERIGKRSFQFVEPGAFGKLKLKPAILRIFCDNLDSRGSLLIEGEIDGLEAVAFNGQKDEEGEILDLSKPIEFSGNQEVIISSVKGKKYEVSLMHIIADDDGGPDDDSEDVPVAPGPLVAV